MWGWLSGISFTDAIFLLIVAVSTLLGGIRGLCQQVLSWAIWITTVYIGIQYAPVMAKTQWLNTYIGNSIVQLMVVVAMMIIIACIVISLSKSIFKQLLKLLGLSAVDRVLGLSIGFFQGVLLSVLIIIGFNQTQIRNENWWNDAHAVKLTNVYVPIHSTGLMRVATSVVDQLNSVLTPLLIESELHS